MGTRSNLFGNFAKMCYIVKKGIFTRLQGPIETVKLAGNWL